MISTLHSTILLENLSSYAENGVMFATIRRIWKQFCFIYLFFFFGYPSDSDVDIKELMEKLLYREQSFGKRYEYFKWAQHRQDEYLVKPQNKGHLPDCAEASTIQLSTVESFLERIVLGFAYAGVPELTLSIKQNWDQ